MISKEMADKISKKFVVSKYSKPFFCKLSIVLNKKTIENKRKILEKLLDKRVPAFVVN